MGRHDCGVEFQRDAPDESLRAVYVTRTTSQTPFITSTYRGCRLFSCFPTSASIIWSEFSAHYKWQNNVTLNYSMTIAFPVRLQLTNVAPDAPRLKNPPWIVFTNLELHGLP
jgi:hypothetical protein